MKNEENEKLLKENVYLFNFILQVNWPFMERERECYNEIRADMIKIFYKKTDEFIEVNGVTAANGLGFKNYILSVLQDEILHIRNVHGGDK